MPARLRLLDHRRRPATLALDTPRTILCAAALFGGFYALQSQDSNPADALEVLYVLPIAVLALRFGLLGGLAGAAAGIVLIAAGHSVTGVWDMSSLGNVCWATVLLLLGILPGRFVDRRRSLEADIARSFEESIDLLATADTNGRFTRVNRAWERTLGHSAETMCSRPFTEFVHPADLAATTVEHQAVVGGARDAVGFRNRYRAADGSYRWLEWSGHSAEIGGVVHAVARDVTTLHEAEEQLANHAQLLESEVAQRTHELEDSRTKALQRMALASEYRDGDTFHHTARVGQMSAQIGAHLCLGEQQVAILREAAPLHDVGKIGIPDSILLKPGKLTPQEYETMKTHAELGARLLDGSGSPVLQMATVIAESHHERWDGAGYPHGLAGELIPLPGRIVAVADVYDALINDRPYKRAWSIERAVAEIAAGAGGQFDPSVVKAFLEVQREAGVNIDHAVTSTAAQHSSNPPRTGRPGVRA